MPEVSICPASADLVARIMHVICASGLRSVHYTGAADEGLLRALLSHQLKLEISVMDMPDHWGTGYAFWYDEVEFGNCLPRERPEWLEEVPFYQEGSPDHEIGIFDWPWGSSDQLERIVDFDSRRPPEVLILFGFADQNFVGVEGLSEDGRWERHSIIRPMPYRHPSYDWEIENGLIIGRWKEGTISAYDRRQQSKRSSNSNL